MITGGTIEVNMKLTNENKDANILYALKKFSSVPGKDALQKIMYFASMKSNAFPFRWNKYGPYSEELKYAFDDAIMEGTVDYTKVDMPIKDSHQFNIKLTRQGEELLSSFVLDDITKESIEFAYQILKNKSPRRIELLSYVHYIANHNDSKIDVLSVLEILKRLKPSDGFSLEDISSIMEELRELKLIV
jgi:uncharacterized protein YwgA